MARIRTIKPEFWTDAKIVCLPFEARLLFIGMWNFADDEGCLADEPETIRLQVLPADQLDAAALIERLVELGMLERRETTDGRRFLRIVHFGDHQRVQHPTPSKFLESSQALTRPHEDSRALTPEGNGKEGNGKEGNTQRAREICDHLADAIAGNGVPRPNPTRAWQTAAQQLLDDGIAVDDIRHLITWAQRNEFWRGRITTMPGLRKHWTTVALQAKDDVDQDAAETAWRKRMLGAAA